ncbi:hypothetical protein GCM10011512_18800 [Tersicoccus solisilvae]|uniref:DUF8094 domain-containing protein n=1 Tax=Tersicoccus solisilvae TaxID=1882339 RepID=A0ABQ1P9T5_9MICC|nr:hypothetical protein [Tersicoccus solisilvae]GGC91943.1 hypothetical protein GCM10011512_18800 [Tersicoccus solisilvae]
MALLAVGLVALLAGIGMRTWWLPPATTSVSAPAPSGSAPVTVLDSGIAGIGAGRDVDVSIRAAGAFVLAQGRSADVDAWVGPAAHTTVRAQGDGLATTTTDGEARVPTPVDADLFVSAQRATGELTQRWTVPADGDWSLLLTGDGGGAAPSDVTLTWANDRSTPWAVPLIVLGAVALVAGLALLVLWRRAPGRGRPAAGPGRGHGRHAAPAVAGAARSGSTAVPTTTNDPAGPATVPTGTYRPDYGTAGAGGTASDPAPGEQRSTADRPRPRSMRRAVVPGGLALALTCAVLTCAVLTSGARPAAAAPSGTPGATAPASATADATLALQPPQVDRIMGSIADVVGRADAARSAAALTSRMSGEALAERTANYRIRATAPSYRAPAAIAAGPVLAQMITTGTGWPRTVVMVTKDDDSTVPQILTLTQSSARENYRVVSAVGLLPGTTFPQAGSDRPAARPLDPARADGLTSSPRAALAALASVLDAGRPAYTRTIAKNRFVDQLIAGQAAAVKANTGARITAKHTPDTALTRVLQTSDGGALVIGTLRNTVAVAPKEKGGTITLRSELAALAGGTTARTPVEIRYGESVVLYVPAAGSREAAQVIGAAQELLSVTRR